MTNNFNPRSPCGERLLPEHDTHARNWISIHAPRVGSDLIDKNMDLQIGNFNPRSPCGERRFASL